LKFRAVRLAIALLFVPVGGASADEWLAYGRDPGGTRYSPLTQITPDNVERLRPAWIFHTGDVSDGKDGEKKADLKPRRWSLDGRLYLTTSASTESSRSIRPQGRQLWAYDPTIDRKQELRRRSDQSRTRNMAGYKVPPRRVAGCGFSSRP
jgi:quinoprotein glucose dehydrogenase